MTAFSTTQPSEQVAFCPCCGCKLAGFEELAYGNIVLRDLDWVIFEGEKIPLPRSQFQIVDALVRARGRGISRSTLAMIIGADIFDNSVTQHVVRARKSFRSVIPDFNQLQVIRGFGAYRWTFRPCS